MWHEKCNDCSKGNAFLSKRCSCVRQERWSFFMYFTMENALAHVAFPGDVTKMQHPVYTFKESINNVILNQF